MAGGKLSPVELVEMFAARIERYNAQSKAFITVTAETAREEAKAIARADLDQHRFTAIPYAVKDLFDVAGVLTSGGSRVFHDRIAQKDAFAVARLRGAKSPSLGKTNLHEFAYGATGENETFGTCGSVRAPAALNGLVGLKPTIGRIPTSGVVPYCWTLDHVGLMTRSVEDCADLLEIVAGYDPSDPSSVNRPVPAYARALGEDIAGTRIGIPTNFYFDRTDDQILAAIENVKSFLVDKGCTLVPVTFPDMSHSRTVSLTVQMPEALSAHSAYLQDRGHLYGADFRAGLALGQCVLAEHYVRAKRFIEIYRQQTNALFSDVDLILTPATPEIAQKIGTVKVRRDGVDEAVGNAITRFTTFFNMTGHPALTMPCGMHSEGLPIGLQLVGGYFQESTIFRVASAIGQHDAFHIPLPKLDH
jgi:aspartyl-tRNA(Asn)/glutamyl-tRNA(Gln) amidotransferase subunit A